MFTDHAVFYVVGIEYCLDISSNWLAQVTQIHLLLLVLHRMGLSNHRDLLHNGSCCIHRILCNNEKTKETWKSLLTFSTLEMGNILVPGCNPLGDHHCSCVLEYPLAWRKQPFFTSTDRWDDVSSVPSCIFDNWFLHEPNLLRDWLDLHLNRHFSCLWSCEHWLHRSLWKSCLFSDELGFFR